MTRYYRRNRHLPQPLDRRSPPEVKPSSGVGSLWTGVLVAVSLGFLGIPTLLGEDLNTIIPFPSFSLAEETPETPETPTPVTTTPPQPLTPEEIYAQANPAVVGIETQDGFGTGVFITNQGLLITNAHVVGNYSKVEVKTFAEEYYLGEVLATDTVNDLALVQIPNTEETSALPINSNPTKIGQKVYLLGNPLGLERTFTEGNISRFEDDGDLQHTAPSAPGNSGSPVIDQYGNIIAIDKAWLKDSYVIGFATPAIKVEQLLENP